MRHNLRWATITMTAPTKATNTVGNSPPPAETPRARKIQPPHDAPDQTENQVPDQPVASPPHDEPSQPAGETLPPSPGAGPSASASPSQSRLTSCRYHNINYIANRNYIIFSSALGVRSGVRWAGRRW